MFWFCVIALIVLALFVLGLKGGLGAMKLHFEEQRFLRYPYTFSSKENSAGLDVKEVSYRSLVAQEYTMKTTYVLLRTMKQVLNLLTVVSILLFIGATIFFWPL